MILPKTQALDFSLLAIDVTGIFESDLDLESDFVRQIGPETGQGAVLHFGPLEEIRQEVLTMSGGLKSTDFLVLPAGFAVCGFFLSAPTDDIFEYKSFQIQT